MEYRLNSISENEHQILTMNNSDGSVSCCTTIIGNIGTALHIFAHLVASETDRNEHAFSPNTPQDVRKTSKYSVALKVYHQWCESGVPFDFHTWLIREFQKEAKERDNGWTPV